MSEIFIHGELVTPMGLRDALDIVEDELGVDFRQYLEEYLTDGYGQEDWTESDLLSDQKEHYLAVLGAIDVSAAALEQQLSQNRINRKALMTEVDSIRKIIEREESK